MCEERIVKMKRDMRLARRRARRLLQIHNFITHPIILGRDPMDVSNSSESDISSDRASPDLPLQTLNENDSIACLQHIAARTIVLMRRNAEIQRRVQELTRETAVFLTSVMSNPENQRRFQHVLEAPTPFQTPPASETSSVMSDDVRNLPETEDTDANDSYDVELKPEIKQEPRL